MTPEQTQAAATKAANAVYNAVLAALYASDPHTPNVCDAKGSIIAKDTAQAKWDAVTAAMCAAYDAYEATNDNPLVAINAAYDAAYNAKLEVEVARFKAAAAAKGCE